MSYARFLILAVGWMALFVPGSPATAADLIIQNQTITGARTYDSPEATIFDHVVLAPTADVIALTAFEVVLKPGTRIQKGARFIARMKDFDGLPNRWEMEYCETLEHGPMDDPDYDVLVMIDELGHKTYPCDPDSDDDGMPDGWEVENKLIPLADDAANDPDQDDLTNLAEYEQGTDPHNPDTDGDGMTDGWEVANGLDPLSNDANGDLDGDGYTNWIEFMGRTDPADAASKPAYFIQRFDQNGNLVNMEAPTPQ